jgi:hypothetical protein
MFKPKAAAAAVLMIVAATLLPLSPASAATAPAASTGTRVASNPDCIAYARKNLAGQNWTCFGGVLGSYGTRTSGAPKATKVFTMTAKAPLITTEARVNDYFSNTTEPLVASIRGVQYVVPINLKVGLYNHSATVTMSYTSSQAVSVTWRMRIQRDVPLWFDDTIYRYSPVYGSSFFTRGYGPRVEQYYGAGYNRLPYDGQRYFFDLYDITLKTPTGQIGILGSVQSDRATCYKTVSCKFK